MNELTVLFTIGLLLIVVSEIVAFYIRRKIVKEEGIWIASLLKEKDTNFNKPNPYLKKLLLDYKKSVKGRFKEHVRREMGIKARLVLYEYYYKKFR